MSGPIDTLPALVVPALVLLALVVGMGITGPREARRRAAWTRFLARARALGLRQEEVDALSGWAREDAPDAPERVLERRSDFDRFARAEATRRHGSPAALASLAALRATLGFGPTPGRAVSTHDVRPGEVLDLRDDHGHRAPCSVASVDESGIAVVGPSPRAGLVGPLWATFGRDGEATYRFRTRIVAPGALAHGEFLVREERRRDPRVALRGAPFWVALDRLPDGFALEDPEGVEVEVLDVSTGGLALLADRDVRRGSELELDLDLGGGRRVAAVRAKVLSRGFREGGGRRPHFLRCAFVGLDPVQRRELESFVSIHEDDAEPAGPVATPAPRPRLPAAS